ncbi:Palmitoyl-acyl carrier protein thioesterase, chloroplastic [Linum perenne]
MVAASLFPLLPQSGVAKSDKLGRDSASLSRIRSKSAASGASQVRASAQAPLKINGTSVGFAVPAEVAKHDTNVPSQPPPRTFINTLPDWSVLLAAITTIFLAAEKQWTMLDWKPKRPDMLIDPFGLGRIVQDGFVFRQNFSIRSYEIGADRSASIETLMNHLQETALNHVKTAGLLVDGFGATPEMSTRNLIWVVTRMQVLVDRYPTWGDVVQVDTWVTGSGKNGMRRDWLIRDCKTGETLTRASSVWVMMNKLTRRLSKIPEEVRAEIEPFFLNSDPVVPEDSRKLIKLEDNTADHIRKGLTSAPVEILESHELSSMTLEYRRECGKDSVLQSLTAVSGTGIGSIGSAGDIECQHLLRLEEGAEIVRGRTEWKPKYCSNFGTAVKLPAENA